MFVPFEIHLEEDKISQYKYWKIFWLNIFYSFIFKRRRVAYIDGRLVGWSSKYFENSRNKCFEGFYATGGGFGRTFCLYDEKVEKGKEKEEEREEEEEWEKEKEREEEEESEEERK